MPRAEFEPTNPDLMETVLATELPRQPLWSDSNITLHVDSKETSTARHLLQGLSDWELLLQTVETCSSDQMKVSQHISNKLFIIGEVNSQSHYIRPVKSAGSPYLTITFWECFSTGSSFKQCLSREQYFDQGRLADIVPIVVTASVTRLCSLAAV